MWRITSKQPGFRRCGVAHPGSPTDYPDDTFTAEEIALLEAEPMLTVTRLTDKESGSDSKKAAKGK